MTKLVLIRGLPGSGKSTYAKTLDFVHYEADQFFELDWGEYKFDARMIKIAHEWCYSKTVRALRRGHDVVVSNTFTQLWELNKYLEIPSIVDGVEIEIVEMKSQYGNVHGVPEDTLAKMKARWEDVAQACIDQQGLDIKQVM